MIVSVHCTIITTTTMHICRSVSWFSSEHMCTQILYISLYNHPLNSLKSSYLPSSPCPSPPPSLNLPGRGKLKGRGAQVSDGEVILAAVRSEGGGSFLPSIRLSMNAPSPLLPSPHFAIHAMHRHLGPGKKRPLKVTALYGRLIHLRASHW